MKRCWAVLDQGPVSVTKQIKTAQTPKMRDLDCSSMASLPELPFAILRLNPDPPHGGLYRGTLE